MLRRFAIGWIMRRIFDRVDEDGSGLALHRWITHVFMCSSEVRYASCATRVFSVVCWTRGVWHQCLEVLLVITDLILVRGLSPNVFVSCWFNDAQWNSSKHWSSHPHPLNLGFSGGGPLYVTYIFWGGSDVKNVILHFWHLKYRQNVSYI